MLQEIEHRQIDFYQVREEIEALGGTMEDVLEFCLAYGYADTYDEVQLLRWLGY